MNITTNRVAARDRNAFTLVELLVVVAIIGVLIALLMPTLRRARDAASSVACQSNIRQLYTTFVNYGVDNNRWLPQANNIMNRQWVGWSFAGFLHNKISRYVSPRSTMWMDPGWPAQESYDTTRTVIGTIANPAAGNVDYSPANLGEGYYYVAYDSAFFGYGWGPANIRFGVPARPENAKLLSCMCAQQAPSTGLIGPHNDGKVWNVLWLDGHLSRHRGVWGSPVERDPVFNSAPDLTIYVNYAGQWKRKGQ